MSAQEPSAALVLVGPPTPLTPDVAAVTLDTLDDATRDLRVGLVGMVELGAQEWREARGDVMTPAITVDGETVPPRLPADQAAPLIRALAQAADVFTRISADFKAAADAAREEAGIEAEAMGNKDRADRTLAVIPDGDAVLKVRPKFRDVTNVDSEKLGQVLASLAVARDSGWEPPACTGHPEDPEGHYFCVTGGDGVCPYCGQDVFRRCYDEGRADGAAFARAEMERLGTISWRITDLRALGKTAAAAGMPDLAALADSVVERVKVPTGGWQIDRDTGARRR